MRTKRVGVIEAFALCGELQRRKDQAVAFSAGVLACNQHSSSGPLIDRTMVARVRQLKRVPATIGKVL
jgi:hypothetical protein